MRRPSVFAVVLAWCGSCTPAGAPGDSGGAATDAGITDLGASCTLDPYGIAPGDQINNANYTCDLQPACMTGLCLSYRTDGDNTRPPFCSQDCVFEEETCTDPRDPTTCASPHSNCPPDPLGSPGVCTVVNEVVGPGEWSNCLVTFNGVERYARCVCVPCCAVNAALCNDSAQCT